MIGSLVEFGKVIRKRREEKGMTLDVLAAATGISKPYLSNIETARAPGPPTGGKLKKLEGALGFGSGELAGMADWLRTPASVRAMVGAGGGVARRADGAIDLDAMLRKGDGDLTTKARRHEDGGGKKAKAGVMGINADRLVGLSVVPLINKVPAGKAGEFGDLDYPVGVADEYVVVPEGAGGEAGAKGVFAVRVVGDSMEPEYREGDVVVVSGREPEEGDDCLVRMDEGENFATTFKRVFFEGEVVGGQWSEGAKVRLVPLNKKHEERVVGLGRVTGIYPVVWKISAVRKGRKVEKKKGKVVEEVERPVVFNREVDLSSD